MELSVVIPVLDEVDNVEPVFGELVDQLEGRLEFEAIFVDDGSRDATPTRLLRLASQDRRVAIVTHEQNKGKSAALVSGVAAASARWVATLDGDGQNDPADLLQMYRLLGDRDRPLLVAGERTERDDRWLRRVSSRVANRIRRCVLVDGVYDSACGVKLFPRDEFLALPRFSGMHRFLPALFGIHGVEVIAVPVRHRPRLSGRAKYGFWNRVVVGVVDLVRVARMRRH